MSHELEFTNGTADFLGREVAWHKLGQVIGDSFDIDTMRERCPELVMPVHVQPSYAFVAGEYVEHTKTACVVREDGKVVGEGVGKDSYQVVQQQDVFEWGAQIADLGDFPFISAGLLRDGSQFFATLDAGGFGLAGLRVNSHLTVCGSHDRSMNVMGLYSHTVVVCANTFAAAQATATDRVTIRHTASAEARMAAAVKAVAGLHAWHQAEQAVFEQMAAVKVTARRFDLLLDGVLPSLDEKARGVDQREEARDAIRTLAKSPVVADAKGTGLGFVQAVNTYENWNGLVRGRRGRELALVRAERQFDAVAKGNQPLTAAAIKGVLVNA